MKFSTLYDSEYQASINKLSTRLFNGKAKLKASFDATPSEVSPPSLNFVSEFFEATFNAYDQSTFLKFHTKRVKGCRVTYAHDVQEKDGQISADWHDGSNIFNATAVFGLRDSAVTDATLTCPLGGVVYQHFEVGNSPAGVRARLMAPAGKKGQVLAEGSVTTSVASELTYKYKDEDITVIGATSFPSLYSAMTFKRRFDKTNKLGLKYFPTDTSWKAEYRLTYKPDMVMKAGYVSLYRTAYVGAFLGKIQRSAKLFPKWGAFHAMIQVPIDTPREPIFLLKWKKRWDFFDRREESDSERREREEREASRKIEDLDDESIHHS